MKRRIVLAAGIACVLAGCGGGHSDGKDAGSGTKSATPSASVSAQGASDGGGSGTGNASDGGGRFSQVDVSIAQDTASYYGADSFSMFSDGSACMLSKDHKLPNGRTTSRIYTGTCKLADVEGKKIYKFDQYEKGELAKEQG